MREAVAHGMATSRAGWPFYPVLPGAGKLAGPPRLNAWFPLIRVSGCWTRRISLVLYSEANHCRGWKLPVNRSLPGR